MAEVTSFNESQLDRILAALSAPHDGWWWHWIPVASVFVSAFLAMMVGIRLETYKDRRARAKDEHSRKLVEISKINTAISATAYNIERCVHLAGQQILPHHEQSHEAHAKLQEIMHNSLAIPAFLEGLREFPAIFMTCPPIYFMNYDFFAESPFADEKNSELLKKSAWIRSFSGDLSKATNDRNRYIEEAVTHIGSQRWRATVTDIDKTLLEQARISNAECVAIYELLRQLTETNDILQEVNKSYLFEAKKTTVKYPPALQDTMTKLKQIYEGLIPTMPTWNK